MPLAIKTLMVGQQAHKTFQFKTPGDGNTLRLMQA